MCLEDDRQVIYRWCLQLIYILVHFCGFLNPLVWIFMLRASAISKPLIWAMCALYAYPCSVGIIRSVQPVGLYLVSHKQQLIDKEKLQMHDVMIYFCASITKANRPRPGEVYSVFAVLVLCWRKPVEYVIVLIIKVGFV